MPVHTTLASDGSIVLPTDVCIRYGWSTGQQLELVATANGLVIRPVSPFPETQLDDVVGAVDYTGPTIPTDQLSGMHALKEKETSS